MTIIIHILAFVLRVVMEDSCRGPTTEVWHRQYAQSENKYGNTWRRALYMVNAKTIAEKASAWTKHGISIIFPFPFSFCRFPRGLLQRYCSLTNCLDKYISQLRLWDQSRPCFPLFFLTFSPVFSPLPSALSLSACLWLCVIGVASALLQLAHLLLFSSPVPVLYLQPHPHSFLYCIALLCCDRSI